ncbi:hypothetical protein DXA38_00660 [[Clostridium] innocuum]|uniref:Uncharacterized protein n=1 Tax=Clostridium innocuum TaxID=1522 RepID=A0A3E2W4B0_CLOIN|nr:hypothetical protein DXA38_00660 [[Clostridium] innocuum]RHV69480.1 hypothetical protein DXB22_00975 [Clostridiaceae bacterium OM02-2AC]
MIRKRKTEESECINKVLDSPFYKQLQVAGNQLPPLIPLNYSSPPSHLRAASVFLRSSCILHSLFLIHPQIV